MTGTLWEPGTWGPRGLDGAMWAEWGDLPWNGSEQLIVTTLVPDVTTTKGRMRVLSLHGTE